MKQIAIKHLVVIAFCLSAITQLKGQNRRDQDLKGNIRGTVKNTQNEPFAAATISLVRAADSTIVLKQQTNNKGQFNFSSIARGHYRLSITATGMKEYRSVQLAIDDQHLHIDLPAIILQHSKPAELKEVVVTSRRRLIEQDIDKVTVNVDAMISSATSNALEVLSKTPGVTVNNKEEIGLNGKDGVLVMIDGRATYLSATDLAAYLKSIPGNMLDKIELMDNPSSKYDAAGSAIINIRLKKNRAGGLTGNLAANYSQGVYARHNESINLNYNRKKINAFGSFSYGNEKNYSADTYDRKFYAADKSLTSSVLLDNLQRWTSTSYFTRFGMDYYASPKTTYGLIVNINTNPRSGTLQSSSTSTNAASMVDSVGTGNITGTNHRNNWGANMNFGHKFNNKGRELSADVNYLNYSTPGKQDIVNTISGADGGTLQSEHFAYDLLPSVDILTLKADYTHPLKKKGLFEAGIKSSYVNNNDNAAYFDVLDSAYLPDYSKSNHFVYKEQVQAAYVNMRKLWKRVGVQLGLRAEHTLITGTLLANPAMAENSFSRQYTNLFPSAFASYRLDSNGNNTLSVNISRRIRRPNYQQLNPFLIYRDGYSYSTGNPFVTPQFQYRGELKYQYKQLLGVSVQYGRFTDVIFDITQVVDNLFITRPENIAGGNMIVLTTNLNKNILSWWSVNANLMLAHMELDGVAYGQRLNPKTSTMRLNILNQFSFKKGWSGELTAYYSGKDISGQTITQPRYRLYGAVQKKILKDKGAIRLSLEDLFHLWVQKDESVGLKQATSYHTNESDTQRIGIAFNWRFGKESSARKSKHADNAADAEKERVN